MKIVLGAAGSLLFLNSKPALADTVSLYLARFFRDKHNVAAIGKRYLACAECALDEQKLLSLILPGAQNPVETCASMGYPRFEATMRQSIREDFLRGDVANLDGWILSKTELHLCSLVALKNGVSGHRSLS